MQKIHFIAIGGAAMHNLAIALKRKAYYQITGSDDEIFDPSYTRLKKNGLLPQKMGWYPERIHSDLDAIVLGMHATEDNPELLKAKEIGLKIYSFPEFLYEQTCGKTRVVIGGSHGKTSTTAMILHVMKESNVKTDFMVGAQIEGFENMVSLSYESKIAIFEGDEYLTSTLDRRPKFHLYKPNIAVLTGIAWDHINVFPTYENYVEQFEKFVNLMEHQGRLIYYSQDKKLSQIARNSRTDIICFPYTTPSYTVKNGTIYLKTKVGEFPLKIFGEHNLQNLEAARLVCKQLGIMNQQFYKAMTTFPGAANRLEKIVENTETIVYKDFAHSPSKLKATVDAIKLQYSDRKIVACMELHTFSSLREDFLPEYKNTMANADVAVVYYNPKVIEHKRLNAISPEQIREAFGQDNMEIFTETVTLQKYLKATDYANSVLLMMSSGNFGGIKVEEFATELIGK